MTLSPLLAAADVRRPGWRLILSPTRALLAFATLLAIWLTAAPIAAQEAALVRVDKVTRQVMSQTVPVIGRLVARQAGEVSARIDGPIETFLVEVGDRVEAGQVIAVLNRDSLKAHRDIAASQLGEMRAELATEEAEEALARQEFQRLEGLKKSAAFSQARHEDSRQTVAIAAAKVRRAASAVASAEAELRLHDINLSYTEVRAPYDGVVTRRMSEAGTYVGIGDPLVYLIADRSLEIEADVPFQRLTGLTPGTRVALTLDDGTRHEASVRATLPSENPLTRTRAVRFVPRFNGVVTSLADAQSVTVQVPAGRAQEVLTVHKDAIVRHQGKEIVYVVKDGSAESRPIRVGEALGSRLEVIEGLAEGEAVVVRGNERLLPGAKVIVDGES